MCDVCIAHAIQLMIHVIPHLQHLFNAHTHYLNSGIEFLCEASDVLKDAARKWIDKLNVKNGSYPPDSYPNPGESDLSNSHTLCTFALDNLDWDMSLTDSGLQFGSFGLPQCPTRSERFSRRIRPRVI